jgi:predicted TIM-barrel fold metal-dependent hydrolase
MPLRDGDRYLVISSDGHAGAPLDVYRDYLESEYHDDFAAWKTEFRNPHGDLVDTESREYRRNFDSAIRQADLEADGIVGEILFPNTIPPFYSGSPFFGAPDPEDARELELRWAGIRAHNRWLVDFCNELPGRRAGIAQLLLDDVDRAVEEVRWTAAQGLMGGVLVPNPNADSALPQLHAPLYEPIWTECEALGLPVNTHGGGGVPNLGPYPSTPVMMFLEFGWYSQRPLVRLIFSGVFERHPNMKFVMTETGNSWVPDLLDSLDWFAHQIRTAAPNSVEAHFGGPIVEQLSLKPSEYWMRQCYLGSSFMGPKDCALRHATGVDRVMWGADYPHAEGTHPYTMEALRYTFAGIDEREVRMMLGDNAVDAYGFDTDALAPVVARIGPKVGEVARPLEATEFPPEDATSMVFGREPQPA